MLINQRQIIIIDNVLFHEEKGEARSIQCAFNINNQCLNTCAAFMVLEQKGIVTKAICLRFNGCIGCFVKNKQGG